MPLYPYRCDACGLEFEVSRKMSEAASPANCPMDGSAGVRIFTAPTRLSSGRGEGSAPPAAPAAQKPASPWSHFGHSHGFGAAGHSHGGPRPTPPA